MFVVCGPPTSTTFGSSGASPSMRQPATRSAPRASARVSAVPDPGGPDAETSWDVRGRVHDVYQVAVRAREARPLARARTRERSDGPNPQTPGDQPLRGRQAALALSVPWM